MSTSREKGLVSRVVSMNRLMDFYGSLLTDKQRQFMRMHYEQDLSFGEIAREFSISRQAVHDSVQHAENTLRKLESKLHLLEKAQSSWEESSGPLGAALESLRNDLKHRDVIYNPDWIVEKIDNLLGKYETSLQHGSEEESAVQA